jgi:mannose/cellobiose epimerase-like protein (N-acyl-D-glucosamine 2-epimerase family)
MDVNKDAIEMLSMAFAINGADATIRQAFERHIHVVLAAFGKTETPGYFFTPEWEPLPGYWRPSEAVQGAALLLEVASTFPDLPVVDTAWRLIRIAVADGWDEKLGGVIFELWPGRKPRRHARREAPWWAQVELLRAVESLRELRPDDPDVAQVADMARRAVDRTIDRTYGGIFTRPPDSVPLLHRFFGTRRWRSATAKGSMWKDASHDGRALLRVAALGRRPLQPGPPRVNIEQDA